MTLDFETSFRQVHPSKYADTMSYYKQMWEATKEMAEVEAKQYVEQHYRVPGTWNVFKQVRDRLLLQSTPFTPSPTSPEDLRASRPLTFNSGKWKPYEDDDTYLIDMPDNPILGEAIIDYVTGLDYNVRAWERPKPSAKQEQAPQASARQKTAPAAAHLAQTMMQQTPGQYMLQQDEIDDIIRTAYTVQLPVPVAQTGINKRYAQALRTVIMHLHDVSLA